MRTNLEHARISDPRLVGLRNAPGYVVLTGTFNIPENGPSVWALDGGAGSKTVRLPTLELDKQVVIANVGTTNDLNITDSSGSALVTLPFESMAIFFSGARRWIWLPTPFLNTIASTVVLISSAIAATDVEVQVNGSGAVVLTLPSSIVWSGSAGRFGLPLTIVDISGNAAANNITINPAGGQTISGLASLTIDTNYGVWRLRPKSGGGWVIV